MNIICLTNKKKKKKKKKTRNFIYPSSEIEIIALSSSFDNSIFNLTNESAVTVVSCPNKHNVGVNYFHIHVYMRIYIYYIRNTLL